MALRQLRLDGDPILHKTAKPVKEITPSTLTLLDDMLETMHEKNGVGLAAPQVGILRRIAIIEHEDVLYELINPTIVSTEGTQTCNEACLSIPGKSGDIERPFKMVIEAMNRTGETVTHTVDDFLASAFSHELDHLDGVLYTAKATNVQVNTSDNNNDEEEA